MTKIRREALDRAFPWIDSETPSVGDVEIVLPNGKSVVTSPDFDPDQEFAILDAIGRAIVEARKVPGTDIKVERNDEAGSALTTSLAGHIAMRPDIMSSPARLRKFTKEIAKRLERQALSAVADPRVKQLIDRRRSLSGVKGRA